MRVVVKSNTAGSMETTIRRQIWMPSKKLGVCEFSHLYNSVARIILIISLGSKFMYWHDPYSSLLHCNISLTSLSITHASAVVRAMIVLVCDVFQTLVAHTIYMSMVTMWRSEC